MPSAIFLPETSTISRCENFITARMMCSIRTMVMRFSQRLIVLVSGKKIADGRPEAVIRDPEVERAYLGQ